MFLKKDDKWYNLNILFIVGKQQMKKIDADLYL